MSAPLSDGVPQAEAGPASADRRDRDRRILARKWAYLISLTAYLPMPHAEVELELLELVHRVFDAATEEPLPTDRVVEVGARLVRLRCVGKTSLQCSMDVLAGALLSEPDLRRFDRLAERVARLLGALASGYAEEIRLSTMEQQDNLHRALLEAIWESERGRRAGEAWLSEVLDGSPAGIAITDLGGWFLRSNAALDRILGRPAAETRSALFDLAADQAELRAAYEQLRTGSLDRLTRQQDLLRPDGTPVRVSLSAVLVRDADGEPSTYVTLVTHVGRPDALTGLPDREHLAAQLETTLRQGNPATLYELEVDAFPAVTGALGQAAGDDLVRTVAERLRALPVTVARLDGATFGLLADGPPEPARISEALAEPMRVGDVRLASSVSIGAVTTHVPGAEPTELLHAADLALRHAKGRGGGHWALSDPDRDERHRQTLELAATMPGALDGGQVRIGHEPVVRLADEHLVGVDVLVRWDHPEFGPLQHQRCVALAELCGPSVPLLRRLLRGAGERSGARLTAPMCVGLIPGDATDPELADRVLAELAETGLPPERLQLSWPASVLHTETAAGTVHRLTAAGVLMAVHDLGVLPDYLTLLEELPVSTVRFTERHRAPASGPGPLVAKATRDLITLVHLAAATVTVTGIRTGEQAGWWLRAGADAATGPLFARAR